MIINLYNYTKLALFIILVPTTILLITSTFLPYTNHELPDEKKEDLDAYEEIKEITGHKLYFIPIFIAFITLTIFLSYSRVKSKVLMDLRYISPYLIILFEGVIGTILIFIMVIVFSTNKCSDTIADFCYVEDLENEEKVYIDNAEIYFQNLKKSGNQMYIEIFLIIHLYIIINFLEFTCETLIIYYFNPNFILVRDNLYYGTIRLIFVLANKENFQSSISLTQFIILELSELLSIFAYGIYLEIIEIRFCGFDLNLKRNISERADTESSLRLMDTINEVEVNKLYNDDSEEGNPQLDTTF